ncbi:hypothetical protein [Subtercola lobariae]|uniref:Uncharacterized protein n=1 Tax=Subtercola lobariae TaxID=1588641 RepID=A0A917EX11_9MICO|nr:hypothetical protein [Subtercola lobariae]GGF29160.1 hypothetical protein GCM10011399_22850 [Subtercola lobariae]
MVSGPGEIAAIRQADAAADPQAFLNALVAGATRALGEPVAAGVLVVERTRSLGDRVAGRPGQITELRLVADGTTMSLRPAAHAQWVAETHRVSGGVVIARQTQALGEWLNAFAGRIAAVAGDAAGDAAASGRALQALGIHSPTPDAAVTESNVDADLRSLPARVAGRMPAEAQTAVERISALLLDALPRVSSGEPDVVLRRAATVYLPDTLRAYLALPPDWAQTHVFADGSTPDSALVTQLAVLESAVAKLRDAAVANDADALLINGRFLSDRFAVSSLDLQ